MVNSEENMTSIKEAEIQFTIGDSRTRNGTKCGNCNGYQIRYIKLHPVTLTNKSVISVLHANISRVTRSLQKGLQVKSEGKNLILDKNLTEFHFDEKIANKSGEVFLPTAKFYKITNDATLLAPNKRNP